MRLVVERTLLSRGSSKHVNKLVVMFNKAVVRPKKGSTLRMPRALKDDNMDFDDMSVGPWLPLVNIMEA
jgi:hypothetical protein